jgi:hypothetical protein
MPKKYEFRSKHNGNLLFKCCVNSDHDSSDRCLNCRQCTAVTKSDKRCKLYACKDVNFCHIHLKLTYHVVVAKSNIKGAGDGLFCMRRNRGRGSGKRGVKEKPFFKKEDFIMPYNGEILNDNDITHRYDDLDTNDNVIVENTAPYAVTVSVDNKNNFIIDGACIRGAANYINDTHGTNYEANVRFIEGNVYATRDIYKGDELLVDYGKDYWKGMDTISQKEYYVRGVDRHHSRDSPIEDSSLLPTVRDNNIQVKKALKITEE